MNFLANTRISLLCELFTIQNYYMAMKKVVNTVETVFFLPLMKG